MRATVVEIKGKAAVLLQEDGLFIKTKTGNLTIGDVVNRSEKRNFQKGRFGSMVAAAMFAVLIGSGVYTYATPSYYVSLDVNPGITMEVNRFERVISLEAANVDAEEVLEGMELENRNIEDAVSLTVERITDLGYFDEDGGDILIAAMAEDEEKAKRLSEQLEDAVKEEMEENGTKAEVTSKVVGYEMVQAAKEIEGMTPGKYNIIVNLVGIDSDNVQDYAHTSIKDIMKEYKEVKDAAATQKVEEASSEKKSEKLIEKSLKQEEKLSDKTDRAEQKAADKAKQKNNPSDESMEEDEDGIDSDVIRKNTEKKSEKQSESEKEEKKESLEEQKKEQEKKDTSDSEDKNERGPSKESEKESEKEQKPEISEDPERAHESEISEETGKPEVPTDLRP